MVYTNNVSDTLYADVSYANNIPVDQSYLDAGYLVLCFRSNDGDIQDTQFAANYAFCVNAINAGQMVFVIVYYFWRPGTTAVDTHMAMVNAAGGPHPQMVSMIDVETDGGNNPEYDVSDQLNSDVATLGNWLGTTARVIGYANTSDFNTMWQSPSAGLRTVGAGYGEETDLPGQVAHQYTNGTGYGAAAGLPDGAPPWATCDMNSADGLSVTDFAHACGLGVSTPAPTQASTPSTPSSPSITWTLPDDDSIFAAAGVLVGQFMGAEGE